MKKSPFPFHVLPLVSLVLVLLNLSPASAQTISRNFLPQFSYLKHGAADRNALETIDGASEHPNNIGKYSRKLNPTFTAGDYVRISVGGRILKNNSASHYQLFGIFANSENIGPRANTFRFSPTNSSPNTLSRAVSSLKDPETRPAMSAHFVTPNASDGTGTNIPQDFLIGHSNSDNALGSSIIVRIPNIAGDIYFYHSVAESSFANLDRRTGTNGDNVYTITRLTSVTERPLFRVNTIPSLTEGQTNATITINRVGATDLKCRVFYRFDENGTGLGFANSADFTPTQGDWIKVDFERNQIASDPIPIPLNAKDNIYEGNEQFLFKIKTDPNDNFNEASVENPTTGAERHYTLTIQDGDGIPTASFTASYSKDEPTASPSSPVSIGVQLNRASVFPINLEYDWNPQQSTATLNADFTWADSARKLQFPAQTTAKSFNINVLRDTVEEPQETVQLILRKFDQSIVTPGTATTLRINDVPPDPIFSISLASAPPSVEGTTLPIVISSHVRLRANATITLESPASSDFSLTSSHILSGRGPWTVPITLIDEKNGIPEPPETFTIRLNSTSFGSINSLQNTFTFTIIDQTLPEGTELISTGPRPSRSQELPASNLPFPSVTLPSSNSITYHPVATWRVQGEPVWRMVGSPLPKLGDGRHFIEFREIDGFLAPEPVAIHVAASNVTGIEQLAQAHYHNLGNLTPGTISITSIPSNIPFQWRLEGEIKIDGAPNWRNGFTQTTLSNVPAGTHRLEIQSLDSGYLTQPLRTVRVPSGKAVELNVNLIPVNPTSPAKPVALSFQEASGSHIPNDPAPLGPEQFVGQIAGSAGFATGTAVTPRVVLTTAHAVFDTEKLTFANHVRWYPQVHRNDFHPGHRQLTALDAAGATQFIGSESHAPTSWIVLSGYTQRISDSNGFSSPLAQSLDVAALIFQTPVIKGGQSLFSIAPANSSGEWLNPSLRKRFIGYPLEDVSVNNQGRLHRLQIEPNTVTFSPSVNSGITSTFFSNQIISSGGMSGGGLFSEVFNPGLAKDPNGNPLNPQPATLFSLTAIYQGESNGQGVFRVLDRDVKELINNAQLLSNNSSDRDDTHVVNGTVNNNTSEVEIKIGTNLLETQSASAAWRQVGQPTTFRRFGRSLYLNQQEETAVVFSEVDGYITPAIQLVRSDLTVGLQGFHIYAEYIKKFSQIVDELTQNVPPTSELKLGSQDDYDGDGVPNLLEWASGKDLTDPTDFHALDSTSDQPGLPLITIHRENGLSFLRIEYTRFDSNLNAQVLYVPEFSSDFKTWQPAVFEISRRKIANGWERVVVEDRLPIGPAQPKRFARLRVISTE